MSETYNEQEFKKISNLKELRKVIAQKLHDSPKTEDELKVAIPDAKYEELISTLKNMLQLKLISKDGYPVKYSISKEIAQKLEDRRELSGSDKNQIKVSIIIESKADNKGKLREVMEGIIKTLREDKQYLVYESSLADIIVHDGLFSTYITAEVSCLDLAAVFRLVYFYGVTTIDVLKPDKLVIPIADLQQSLFTMVDMTHGYADMMFKLKSELTQISKVGKK